MQAQQSVPDGWSVATWFDLNGWNRNILSDSIVTAVACQIKLSAQSICQAGFFAASLLFFWGEGLRGERSLEDHWRSWNSVHHKCLLVQPRAFVQLWKMTCDGNILSPKSITETVPTHKSKSENCTLEDLLKKLPHWICPRLWDPKTSWQNETVRGIGWFYIPAIGWLLGAVQGHGMGR